MLKRLIQAANSLDEKGLTKEADVLDEVINKLSADEIFDHRINRTTEERVLSPSEWEEENPMPEWDKDEFDNEMDQYEEDPWFRDKIDSWRLSKFRVEETYYDNIAEEMKQKVSRADSLDDISAILEELKSIMQKRDSAGHRRKEIAQEREWAHYDEMSAFEQQEYDHANRQQDIYDMYRNEF